MNGPYPVLAVTMTAMDPYAVLGVRPGSAEAAVTAAYREAAKRWHPDKAGAEGTERMAQINAAYDLVRAAAQHEPGFNNAPAVVVPTSIVPTPNRLGDWLPPAVRLALGRELLDLLVPDEGVKLVTPTSTWASPRSILAVTERRLLWLLDDALVSRVHSLAFRNVSHASHKIKRKHARLTVRTLTGHRHVFHDLRPHTAATIERLLLAQPAA